MHKRFKLIILCLLIAFGGNLNLTARSNAADDAREQAIANEIIAREKASFAAWQRKDKTFYADYWAEDFTEFLPSNPYLDNKSNLMPEFDQLVHLRHQDRLVIQISIRGQKLRVVLRPVIRIKRRAVTLPCG